MKPRDTKPRRRTRRPRPPEEMDGEALLEFHRICDELADAGRLDVADRSLITLAAETWSVWREAARHVAKHKAVIKYPNGAPGANPYSKVMATTGPQLRGLLSELGLTPQARAKFAAGTVPVEDEAGIEL